MDNSNSEGKKQQFYCPVKDCLRGVDGGRPFPRLGQLKQHYDWTHAEKKYSCSKCDKKFGLKDVCSRHEQECGKAFVCESCGGSFRSKNSLAKHLKRKGHQPAKSLRPTVNTSQKVLVLLVPVMRKNKEKKDSSTQTESMATPGSPVSQQFYDNLSPESPDITELLDLAIQTDVSSFSTEMTSNELLDFGTQTSWGELFSSECSSQTPSDWPDCCLNKLLTFDSQTQTVQESVDCSSQT